MACDKDFIEYVLAKLGHAPRFTARAMFGEYGIYADGKIAGFICDNQLLIKPTPQSLALEDICEKDHAYPNSKLYYVVSEEQLDEPEIFCDIMFAITAATPDKKKKAKKKPKKK